MTEDELFRAALAKSPSERAALLDEGCAGNAALRAVVESLLSAHESSGSFLNPSPLVSDPDVTQDSALPERKEAGSREQGSGSAGVPAAGGVLTATADLRQETDLGVVIAGRYALLEKIGEGGMGEVWVAKQTEPVKRKVALKLIKTGMDSRTVLQRFEQERQALALMDHPNIARVLDGGMTPLGQPFFAMELVNGLPLTKFCDEMKLPLNERLELFVPICQAVQHAHQKGIVHRDLKPANILVTMIDGKPVPKVIDFGVAKATSGKLTEETMSTGFGAVVGTLEYMSPEQAGFSGEDIDTRADIYSLGVILYELLTGLRPIDSTRLKKAALTEMIRIIREEEPSKPSTRLSTDESLPSLAAVRQIEPRKLTALLRGELDWVVMKCLEKQRDRRYETANGLARDIQRYLANEAVEARPPSAGYRVRKFIHRNRVMVAAVSSVAAALVLGIIGFGWQANVANYQRAIADKAKESEANQRRLAEQAREAETAALKLSEKALFESQQNTARMTYERAQSLCEEQEADKGLLWMARSLELTPEGDHELGRAIRTSLNHWAGQLSLLGPRYPLDMANIGEVAVSPDGLRLLIVDREGHAKIVDARTGEQRFLLAIHGSEADRFDPFVRGGFSPNGRYVAIVCGDASARIWDTTTGEPVGQPIMHEEPVTGVSFHPNSNILVTCAGNSIHFWNIDRAERQWDAVLAEQSLRGVEISRDGTKLVSWARTPGQVSVWDLELREMLYSLGGVDFEVAHAGISPDGRWVFAGGYQNPEAGQLPFVGQFWDAATGQPVGRRMRSMSRESSSAFFSRACFRPDSQLLVTGGTPLLMWQVPTGAPVGAVSSSISAERPAFLPDGNKLVVIPFRNLQFVELAPVLTPATVATELDGHDHRFVVETKDALHIAPDGQSAIVVVRDKEESQRIFFRLFHLPSGKVIGERAEELGYGIHNGWVPTPTFSSDGRSVATVIGGNACQVLDTTTGQERVPRLTMESRIMAVVFSPNGDFLATGDIDGKVRIWNSLTGQPIGPPLLHKSAVTQLRFSPDSRKLLASGGLNSQIYGEARLWNVATGQALGPELDLLGGVRSIAFSPDGKTFATGAFELAAWDTETSQNLWTVSANDLYERLRFSPDGKTLLASHDGVNAARIYDARTGEPRTPFMRHPSEILSTDLSLDGRLILTSSAGRRTRLWDASSGLSLGPGWSELHGGIAAFNPDGKSILIIDEMNRLMRWDLPQPIDGTPARIRTAIEAGTRISLDSFGTIRSLFPEAQFDPISKRLKLGPDPWEAVERRLRELGGPPGNLQR